MPNGRKPGRPRNPILKIARDLFPDQSERTKARWAHAMRMLDGTETPDDRVKALIKQATRPNGSFNFAEFERTAEEVAAMAIVQRFESDDRT